MKTATQDLLIEIGTEELPAFSLPTLADSFAAQLAAGFAQAELSHGKIHPFYTPRRLALWVEKLISVQPPRLVERKGPALQAAYTADGKPTPAALGFARSCGVEFSELETQKTDKGEWLFFQKQQEGLPTLQLLPSLIADAFTRLPQQRPMRWGAGDAEFLRPVRWVTALYGHELVALTLFGERAKLQTYGHRFHHPQALTLKAPNDYLKQLVRGKVLADAKERKARIQEQVLEVAKTQGRALIDPDLLEEVTGLVEWPVALLGQFDAAFLKLPQEVIITSMKIHQRCFPIIDEQTQLLPFFVAVSNIESKDPERVAEGNARVIRARLSDAAFFYHADIQQRLETRVEKLNHVVFQAALGSLGDKARRIEQLAALIAGQLKTDTKAAARAAKLAKADLLTAMVGEFPELQGVMGSYYARHDGESEAVAQAIREHYQPRFAKDEVPASGLGAIVALADKLDTLVGIFGIGQAPTGESDPFALRRAALGVLRILIEKHLALDLQVLLVHAVQLYGKKLTVLNCAEQVLDFMFERLRAYYAEQHISADVLAAVLACRPTSPLDFDQRVRAVTYFRHLPQAKHLAAANKRVSNILKKQHAALKASIINSTLLREPAERELAQALQKQMQTANALYQQGEYTQLLTQLAALQKPVDDFFDHVMVMAIEPDLRDNRLALLQNLQALFSQVADISLLQDAG